jgi:glycosyltransferase involved in cell wall biosynthesis
MTDKNPLVSIVTPSFNQARYLEETIRSVLAQGYPGLEYIVIDGASSDGSVDVIRMYTNKLAWWVSEKDNGQAEAINKGMSRANGEILAWLNSDDYYLPGAISAAVKAFEENPDVVLVYGNLLAVDENGETLNVLRYTQLDLEDLICFRIIGQPAVFFRRDALDRAGLLDPAYHFLLDHHLWLRIASQGNILYVDETWAAARYHAEAKNRAKAAEFGREAFRILDWMQQTQPATSPPGRLASVMERVKQRSRGSAHRLDARYLLDAGKPWPALQAWMRALFIHPPTALARLNIVASTLLQLSGLGRLRELYLQRRQARFRGR